MTQTTTRVFLGRVRRAPHRSDTYFYATLEPLLESDPDAEKWIGPVHDPVTRFQKRGFIHWHEAPLTVKVGDLWQFTVDEHPSAERRERSEYFQLDNASEPVEVLDLRGWKDEGLLRDMFTDEGIPLSPSPIASRVLLWLSSGLFAGPVRLKGGSAGLWLLDSPEAHRDAARMPVRRIPDSQIDRVAFDGGRWFLSPALDFGQSAGIQNWMSNAQVARSILAKLRKMDPELTRAMGVTDQVFREYLEHVEQGRFGSADSAVERARADRLRGVMDAIQRDSSLMREAADALFTTEAVRALVERGVAECVATELHARQAAIDAELAASAGALARAKEEVRSTEQSLENKRSESDALDESLVEKRREIEATVESFEREVAERLAEIARRPQAIFADAVIMRALAEAGRPRAASGNNGNSRAKPAAECVGEGSTETSTRITQLDKENAVRAALAARAAHHELSLHAMLALHAMFANGLVPLLVGARGYDLLRAYAAATAGARLHWIPVGSSMMEPADVLGRYDSAARRIVPAPSGLLDALLDARHSGRLQVVVFDGFNRAPTEGYLLPILEAMQSGRRGDTARAIPLAPQHFVAEDDRYVELARLAWPPSVLIACLPTDGTATLPLPQSVWRCSSLLDADDRDRAPLSLPAGNVPDIAEISTALWQATTAASLALGTTAADQVLSAVRALSLTTGDATDAARLQDSLTSYGMASTDASTIALATTLVARSSVDGKTIEGAMAAAGITPHGWRTIWSEAARLRA